MPIKNTKKSLKRKATSPLSDESLKNPIKKVKMDNEDLKPKDSVIKKLNTADSPRPGNTQESQSKQ